MEQIKILIADDEADILEIMSKKISAQGYQVVTALDGQEAWDKICLESPDVVILDLTMPKKDGLEVLRNLRTHPPASKWQPVIIVSSRRELEDLQKSFDLEADHYLTKPCNITEVIKAIKLMVSLIPQHK